jgi:hypothetical protein
MGEPRISVSLLYCVSSVFYFHICFILFLRDPIFLTTWCTTLGERCATLVGYCSAPGILLYVKVKVLGSGLCAYGWVTILLYCLWKNNHIYLFSNNWKHR